MITGNKERKIKKYLFINENFGFITAKEGEEIIGVPYGYYFENSYPYIEHRENGIVTITVNAIDVSIIVFDV